MIKVGVIFGGRSVEHEVSVITGLQVIENIDKSKYEPVAIYINKEGKWFTGDCLKKYDTFKNKSFSDAKEIIFTPVHGDRKMYSHPEKKGLFAKKVFEEIDVIFPSVHGTNGEDGTIQGLFELMNIPYTGCNVTSAAVGMDKILMKDVYKSHDLQVVDYTWFYRSTWLKNKDSVIEKVQKEVEYPVFVKPANLGSSVGINKANNEGELVNAIEVAIRYDRKILIEKAVKNPREINCAVMGYDDKLKVSLCEEPLGWKDLLTYEDKYINSSKGGSGSKGGSDKRKIPADLKEKTTKEIERMAKEAFSVIDARGNARIDFLLDENDKVYVNEINTAPGSWAFYLWEATGISFKSMISEMIDIALKVHEEKSNNMYSYDIDLFKRREQISKASKL
ncbi:D-alanine--D-alanine ligase family protein [Abyssisolibacter fermentans]|uniref:D-alanine--D-alanine ligase family protein n=1 Tax=Abyssisolibacter fermentans TaxID=1766203 RepID=UPI000836B12A|nr:D-alanine--D-alanine ligase family protein [Abyssisolibacter fermentans]